MAGLTCPFCGECAMPAWRKLALGWSAKVRCQRCGLKVTVSPLCAIAACLPMYFVLGVALIGINGINLGFGVMLIFTALIAFLITALLYLEWVPLVPGQIKIINPVKRQVEKDLD
jgi:hypothetical protein